MDTNATRAQRAPSWKQGFGDGLSQAVTMVLTPLVFVLIGLGIDALVGTKPVFAVAFGVFGVAGTFAVTYYDYTAKMERTEAEVLRKKRAAA